MGSAPGIRYGSTTSTPVRVGSSAREPSSVKMTSVGRDSSVTKDTSSASRSMTATSLGLTEPCPTRSASVTSVPM